MMHLLISLLVFWVALMIVAYVYNHFIGPMFGRHAAVAPIDLAILCLIMVLMVSLANHLNYWDMFNKLQ